MATVRHPKTHPAGLAFQKKYDIALDPELFVDPSFSKGRFSEYFPVKHETIKDGKYDRLSTSSRVLLTRLLSLCYKEKSRIVSVLAHDLPTFRRVNVDDLFFELSNSGYLRFPINKETNKENKLNADLKSEILSVMAKDYPTKLGIPEAVEDLFQSLTPSEIPSLRIAVKFFASQCRAHRLELKYIQRAPTFAKNWLMWFHMASQATQPQVTREQLQYLADIESAKELSTPSGLENALKDPTVRATREKLLGGSHE